MSQQIHMTLRNDTEIRAYLHRTRMDILAALRTGPATVSQIAAALKVHPANLTRHLRTLLDAGLIEKSHTRDTGRNLEKYYRCVADSFDVAPSVAGLQAPHKVALEFARSDLSAAIAQLPNTIERPVLSMVAAARIPRRDLARFGRRIEELIAEFEASDAEEGVEYHANLSIYPAPWVAAEGRLTLRPTEESQ